MHACFRSLRILAKVAVVATAFLAQPVTSAFAEGPVTVFAAASLKDVLGDISEAWKAETGKDAVLSFAGSSALAKQIEQGAPADLFLSADLKWMDYLDKAGLVAADSRVELLANRIVLIAPKDSAVSATIAEGFPLKDLLGEEHLAMANTDSVPAGTYGKAALQKLGVWDGVKDKVAQAENVRAALLLVSRGEAPLGIVYETDAKADKGVKVVDRFPESTHPAIIYPAAVLKDATNAADAAAFLAYLQGAKAHQIFTDAGFTVLAKTN
ncbi:MULTISPECIES: molybdate ABC transporter substrate-binding protein [Alphaproteobacteria]|uniref:Molybdate ABC transporter substrate-binding protein n=2 Tax=Alphaproteobacteria TaxID=28211 RepID=A0A512HF49_9HYPH|nr:MULTISPECIES: molybdate ABC transporter substrate-binding protein [Alphaproteobacteria]GEO84084.1 molybdate ABC transporter substrate-binding protein [Ciceribacter naphthalenivorans]GLR24620.1 molybdate ABC transporter substrate-binding protein [Ciceribacter naphthalenivorans]GLT07476.1 molybdate ABC transporter substrate-binding protein [Sphingomonas psychrolutea]